MSDVPDSPTPDIGPPRGPETGHHHAPGAARGHAEAQEIHGQEIHSQSSEPLTRVRMVAGAPVIEVVTDAPEPARLTGLPGEARRGEAGLSAAPLEVPTATYASDLTFLPDAAVAVPAEGAPEGAAEEAGTVAQAVSAPGLAATAPITPAPITPAQGGWAVVVLLLTQDIIAELGRYWQVPMGTTLLLAFAFSVVALLVLLPYPLRLLTQDSRWTTRPRIGVMLGALVLSFVVSRGFILFLLSVWPAAASVSQSLLSKGALDTALLFLVAGFAIPLSEEIAFRGLLLRGLERSRGSVYAALASSVLFGVAHGGPLQVVGIIPLAWIMARSVQYTGSLWTSIGIHMLNNTLAVGLGLWLERHNLHASASASALGGLSLEHIPWTLGLAGLLVASAALAVATAWLRPRPVIEPLEDAPRTWTVSTLLMVGLIALSLGYGVWLVAHSNVTPNF